MIANERLVEEAGFMVTAAKEQGGTLNILTMTGSRAYGTNHDTSDYDFRGVYIAGFEQLCSMTGAPQTFEDKAGADITIYELAHFCRLAAKGNPTALEILWGDQFLADWGGEIMRHHRHLFLSKRIAKTYGGYAMSQLKKFEAGSGGSRGVEHFRRRKFKLHTLRLLMVGAEALLTETVAVRLTPIQVRSLWDAADQDDEMFITTARNAFDTLNYAEQKSGLPDEPSEEGINRMIVQIRRGYM